jgi:hypothetical protein
VTVTHAYAAQITKAERDANGDLIVYGKATGPDIDLDEQICDPAWLKSAMPEWMSWGNMREMHQPIVAGIGRELDAKGDDWWLKSQVVDEGTAKKIEAGALKGYSIGIKNAKVVKDKAAPGGRIVGGQIVEVSYVDRPCNPTATLAIAKAAGAQDAMSPVDDHGDVIDSGGEQLGVVKQVTWDGGDDDPDELPDAAAHKTVEPDKTPAMPEEDRAKAVALIEKAVGPDGTQDEHPDIDGGKEAIKLIAQLITYEAQELAAGYFDETCDISLLVRAVECLKQWLVNEKSALMHMAMEEADDDVTYVGLGAEADTAKRDFSADERDAAASSGAAMPDGSFPIKSKQDLKNAIRLAGNAKNPDAARAHIKRRAKALGASDMIPDTWKAAAGDGLKKPKGAKVKKYDIENIVKAAVAEANQASEERVKALEAELAKVMAQPTPGGPVRRPVHVDARHAGDTENKAERIRKYADSLRDPAQRAQYLAWAAEEDAKARMG